MSKDIKKKKDTAMKVKSINKSIRSSTRKMKPILRGLIGKKVEYAIRDLSFSDKSCLLYTSPSPRDRGRSRMPSSA